MTGVQTCALPIWFGGADLITACFPCQDFSVSGHRRGFNGASSHTILHVIKQIQALPNDDKPRSILLENVPGLLVNQESLAALLTHLVDAGFRNVYLRCIDASLFGPQIRKRVFILASRTYDGPTSDTCSMLNFQVDERIRWITQADFPLPKRRDVPLSSILEPEDCKHDEGVMYDSQLLLKNVSPRHLFNLQNLQEGQACAVTMQGASKKFKYHVHPREKCACLRASNHYVYIARKHEGKILLRRLKIVECARLQGAGGYNIPREDLSYSQIYTAFGEAVCVDVVDWLAKHPLQVLLRAKQETENQRLPPGVRAPSKASDQPSSSQNTSSHQTTPTHDLPPSHSPSTSG